MFKKLTVLFLVFLFCFSACGKADEGNTTPAPEGESTTSYTASEKELTVKGVWISYIEIMSECESPEAFSSYLSSMFLNFERVGITDVFFHVRPFADALYPSELFPSSGVVCENQGDELSCDYLSVALSQAKAHNMKLHAWINPYRASADSSLGSLSDSNKAKQWCTEGGDKVILVDSRYYFNPACEEVQQLIVDGAKELLENYPDLAGIHIDDYFYPENWGDADKNQYDEYLLSGGELTLSQWRTENVNTLVRGLYSAVKQYGENKAFSISPSGKTDECINRLYADVELWCSQEGYCDMIMPQIYFGFDNESQPFGECLESWVSLCKNSSVKLVPALALYKCGKEDTYAGESGKDEWINNSDVIKRQVESIKKAGLYGFSLYSGSYVNFSISFYEKELDNLMSVL